MATIKRKIIWDPAFEGWTVNFLKRNFWRVESTMEWEDAMQEMKCVFCNIQDKYERQDKIQSSKHFMALYKTGCTNWMNDLSTRDFRKRSIEVENYHGPEDGEEDAMSLFPGDTDNAGSVLKLLSEMPDDVRAALKILYSGPQEVLDLVCSSIRTGRRTKAADQAIHDLTGMRGMMAKLREQFRSA